MQTVLLGCFALDLLDLSNNNFYGQSFPKYMNLTHLHWLYLDNNHFSEKMDDGLRSSTSLEGLDISDNMLSGNIPNCIGNISTLRVLLMSKIIWKLIFQSNSATLKVLSL